MQGSGVSLSSSIVALAETVWNPNIFAASLMPSMETPSVVAKQIFDRESKEYSLPKYLHIICKQVIPHCMLSCRCSIFICAITNTVITHQQTLIESLFVGESYGLPHVLVLLEYSKEKSILSEYQVAPFLPQLMFDFLFLLSYGNDMLTSILLFEFHTLY